MINVSRTIKYGLRGLLYLAKNSERGFVKIEEISKKENIPENYLRKIFQRLIKNRIVESGVGPKGGVKLPPGSYNVSIAEVIEIIDSKPLFNECTLFGYSSCPNLPNCHLQQECSLFKESLWKKLQNYKLNDLK
jgi:Rrf2 family protein